MGYITRKGNDSIVDEAWDGGISPGTTRTACPENQRRNPDLAGDLNGEIKDAVGDHAGHRRPLADELLSQ